MAPQARPSPAFGVGKVTLIQTRAFNADASIMRTVLLANDVSCSVRIRPTTTLEGVLSSNASKSPSNSCRHLLACHMKKERSEEGFVEVERCALL